MRGREICFLIVVLLIAFVLLQPTHQQPRFTLLRNVARVLKVVLFAQEPPPLSPAPSPGRYEHCPPPEVGAEPPKQQVTDGYAVLDHGNGW